MRGSVVLTALVVAAAAVGAWAYLEPAPARKAWSSAMAMVADASNGVSGHADAAAKGRGKGGHGGDRVPVLTAVTRKTNFPIRRYAIGFIDSPSIVNVSARISSQIEDVHVKDGQMVKAGDLLFSLDDRSLKADVARDQAALLRDQATLENANTDLKRAKDLMTKQAGTKQAYDQADAAAKSAAANVQGDKATLDSDSIQLGFASIKAPISGRLGAVKVTKGNLVTTGSSNSSSQTLVTITQMDPLEVTFNLPESDLPLVEKALHSNPPTKVQVYRDSDKTALGSGTLSFVDSSVDTASGTIQVKAALPNQKLTLWPGQYVDVVVDAGTLPDVESVPTVAVQVGQKGSYVYVVKPDKTAEVRLIKVAFTVGDDSAVTSGLKPGEIVVTGGQSRLRAGTPVRQSTGTTAKAPQKVASDADQGDGTSGAAPQ